MAFNANAAIDPVAVPPPQVRIIDVASPDQVVTLKTLLFNLWNRMLSAEAGFRMVLNQSEFDVAYLSVICTLAAYGSSDRLQSHPEVDVVAHVGPDPGRVVFPGAVDIAVEFRLPELRPLLTEAGIATVRRFARAEATLVFRAWSHRPPSPITPWHRSSGIPLEHANIAFDFANYIDVDVLSVEQRAIIMRAARVTIRGQGDVLNVVDFGVGVGVTPPGQ